MVNACSNLVGVHGKVIDSEGQAIENIKITFYGPKKFPNSETTYSMYTDHEGKFSTYFDAKEKQQGYLLIGTDGYQKYVQPYTAQVGAEERLIVLERL